MDRRATISKGRSLFENGLCLKCSFPLAMLNYFERHKGKKPDYESNVRLLRSWCIEALFSTNSGNSSDFLKIIDLIYRKGFFGCFLSLLPL